MAREKISSSTQLQPGQRIQLEITKRFSFGDTIDSYIMAGKIYNAESNPQWEVLSYNQNENGVVLDIVITDNPIIYQAGPITPAVIISVVIGLSIIFLTTTAYLVTDDITDFLETPAAQATVYSIPLIAIAVIIVAFIYLKAKK